MNLLAVYHYIQAQRNLKTFRVIVPNPYFIETQDAVFLTQKVEVIAKKFGKYFEILSCEENGGAGTVLLTARW